MQSTRMFESAAEPSRQRGLDVQAAAKAAKAPRITAMDFTKGALVLFMVLYHWFNYFIGPHWPYYRYLRFLTPSFIFITGFMISQVYFSKYRVGDSRLMTRLVTRGVKLIAIFVVLNSFRYYFAIANGGVPPSLVAPTNIRAIFITGSFTSKVVSFYILVPISYLLILSGLASRMMVLCRYLFHLLCISMFSVIGVLYVEGSSSQNLEIVAIGCLGIVAGSAPITAINKTVLHPYGLAVLYVAYTAAIALWNVPYPLEVMGTVLTVMIIYMIGVKEDMPGWIRSVVSLLGKYSLLGYVSQIVILQILVVALRRLDLGGATSGVSFVAAVALTIMAVEAVNRGRLSSTKVDLIYRAVFN